jgi:hypothetical protein
MIKNPFDDPKLTEDEIMAQVTKAKAFIEYRLNKLPSHCMGVSDGAFVLGWLMALIHHALFLNLVTWVVHNRDDTDGLDPYEHFLKLVHDVNSDLDAQAEEAPRAKETENTAMGLPS